MISATNKDLIEEVKAGRFREDLYYRLNVFPITMPALRRRKEDIPHLARAFADRFALEQKLDYPLSISNSALALLTAYDWPGNIRQLENAVFRAVVLAEGSELQDTDFPQIAAQLPGYFTAEHPTLVVDNSQMDAVGERGERGMRAFSQDTTATLPLPALDESATASDNVIVSTNISGDVRKLADVEEELIRFALKFYRGQMSQVARKLGIGRSTLYRKLKDYGIDPDDPQKNAA